MKNGSRAIIEVQEFPIVKTIQVEGITKVKPERIKAAMLTREGDVYNPQNIYGDVDRIQKMLAHEGYPFTKVIDGKFDGANLVLRILEPKIERIVVSGNKKTKSSVVLREMRLKKGEIYDNQKMIKSMQNIKNLGFFSDVEPKFSCEALWTIP